ncbi:hypothetical protein BJ878DRAFT_507246 [Calycina marina]|uniref:Uncharacterized protein n=1 Tax=Calycina marina TaxID=1763456 RepID=A0A9P7Z2R4_9HELO|nr:hypothetical protein BJ878DRAFT_507246 [Calycina marina]
MKELLALFLCCRLVLALPGGPTQTFSSSTSVLQQSSLQTTPAPQVNPINANVSLNICGWVDGDINEPLKCSDVEATCLWNSKHNIVGCMTGSSKSLPAFSTECQDYAATITSPAASNVQLCPSSAPYCNTGSFPASYSMFPCQMTKASKAIKVVLSGTALPTPESLPLYLGSDGRVFHEPVATDFSQKGSIIAACVGGGVLLLGLPFGIKMALRKLHWQMAEKAPKTRSLRHPFVQKQLPPGPNFLFSQEWHGTPAAPYPNAHLNSGDRNVAHYY